MNRIISLVAILAMAGALAAGCGRGGSVHIVSETDTHTLVENSPFSVRAFHIDMRAEVMTMQALMGLADDLAAKGINTLIMEWEATFPFDSHAVLCNSSSYTAEEVEAFVAHCDRIGVDVIPLQHCFGHCEYILKHDRYRQLREDKKDPSQVCPLKIEAARGVFSGIFAEVAAAHTSGYFHIGADETYLLGDCPECRAAVEKYGKSKLFVDHVKAMCEEVEALGKTPVMWADIILQHPEAVDELPQNLVFVDWNYGWHPDRFGKLDNLVGKDLRMWGASALRSGPDNWYLTQWMKHFRNISDFVTFAAQMDYEGMIQTSWSTSGLYGFCYDNSYEVLDMTPIRLVYPMSAFGILQDAFCEAVCSGKKLVPEDFIRDYVMSEMGLDQEGAEVLVEYFSMPQEMVSIVDGGLKDASGRPGQEVLEECLKMRDSLSGLKPAQKAGELAHWRLMLDMRINYLRFKLLEAELESDDYSRSRSVEMAARLKEIVSEEAALAGRFARLNKGYLKDAEIDRFNSLKSLKMNIMYENIKNR